MKKSNKKPYSNSASLLTGPLAKKLTEQLRSEVISTVRVLGDKHLTVGFAESCTGGLLSSYFTELAGVSSVFVGSIISYDNKVKQKFLGVSDKSLKTKGAVSHEVAKQMAEGAVSALEVSVAVAITGIAGPSGGSSTKPVGTVFIAVAGLEGETQTSKHHFADNQDDADTERDIKKNAKRKIMGRKIIQLRACIEATKHLNEYIKNMKAKKL